MVTFLHDTCDIFIDMFRLCTAVKVNVYGETSDCLDKLATASFIGVILTWLVCRLTLFPLRLFYGALKSNSNESVDCHSLSAMYVLSLAVVSMNFYWFVVSVRCQTLSTCT